MQLRPNFIIIVHYLFQQNRETPERILLFMHILRIYIYAFIFVQLQIKIYYQITNCRKFQKLFRGPILIF